MTLTGETSCRRSVRNVWRASRQDFSREEPQIIERLGEAIAKGDDAEAQRLIATGVNPNLATRGELCLEVAASFGRVEVVRQLLRAGADVDRGATFSVPPSHKAARNGHEEVVRILLEAGADPNSGVLLVAAGKGHAGVVRLLLEKGADVNRSDPSYGTPLLAAVRADNAEVVQILLEAGANPQWKDTWGKSIFDHAAGKPAILALLKRVGRNP